MRPRQKAAGSCYPPRSESRRQYGENDNRDSGGRHWQPNELTQGEMQNQAAFDSGFLQKFRMLKTYSEPSQTYSTQEPDGTPMKPV